MQTGIRPYEDGDLTDLAQLWSDSWKSTGLAFAQETPRELRDRIPRELAAGWSVFVAVDDLGRLAGFCALIMERGLLDQLFIQPNQQGRGVGLELLNFAKSKMANGLWLQTALDNHGACRFYERHGFRRGEITTHPKHGHLIVRYDWP